MPTSRFSWSGYASIAVHTERSARRTTAVFFISGADAGALVLGTLSSRGRKEPWKPLVILWGVLTGAVAAVLLYIGGLPALQTFTILAATPSILIIIGLCIALYADLRRDPLRQRRAGPVRGTSETATTVPFTKPVDVQDEPGPPASGA